MTVFWGYKRNGVQINFNISIGLFKPSDKVKRKSLSLSNQYSVVQVYQNFFIHSPIKEYLHSFQLLAVMNRAAINTNKQVFFGEHNPRVRLLGLIVGIFNFVRRVKPSSKRATTFFLLPLAMYESTPVVANLIHQVVLSFLIFQASFC